MRVDEKEVLAYRIGHLSIGEHLAQAVAAGRLIAHDDGTWELPGVPQNIGAWLHGSIRSPIACACRSFKEFLFDHAYGKNIVPASCQTCYKVKIVAKNLRQLIALHNLAQTTAYSFKTGLDMWNTYSSDIYAGFFYLDGLEQARVAYRELRQAVDEQSLLGADVAIQIKRGCTEYEIHCGPSDSYAIAPQEIEAWLLARIKIAPSAQLPPKSMTLTRWIQTAFQIGDETYLDLTEGRRLHPKTVSYSP